MTNFFDELDNSPEEQRIRKLDQLKYALEIFDSNSVELKNGIGFGINPENNPLFTTHNFHKFMEYASELNRLIHNFIASSYTLLSITKIVMLGYKEEYPEFYNEFDTKYKTLYGTPVFFSFIQLRNYVQHVALLSPGRGHSWHIDKGQTTEIYIHIDVIIDFIEKQIKRNKIDKVIGNNTVAYLKEFSDQLDLDRLLKEYMIVIHEFYNWVYSHLHDIHKPDLEKVSDIKVKARKEFVPTVLMANIALYKQGDMGNDPTIVFHSTMDGRRFDEIVNLNPDIKTRMIALIDYLDKDIGLPDSMKKVLTELIN